ncbi:acyl-homoserine-lactone synthase [Aliagarivorans taiwanensis]|uniref:acyl-homoserine-lactone synthase n=1 Tax=Aliagarivorans taiwanensis TaxID=561966 RepID=UPI00040DCE22|nr:acyl-homoserine-lactone synthase [Aliagarivorans taiwanensis]
MEFTSGTAKQLNSYNESTYIELANYRYQVFVEKLGWELDTPEGFEKDQFDREDTVYIVSRDEEGAINGCSRLLPTHKPYLLGEVFPQLMNDFPLPCSKDIWEVSRLTTLDTKAAVGSKPDPKITTELAFKTLKVAKEHGAKHVVGVATLMIERLYRRLGLRCHRLGKPQIIDGYALVALSIDLQEQLG